MSQGFRLRATPTEPVVRATSQKLKPGWFQIDITVTNSAPYRLIVDELRRVRPRSARLMAPIRQVSTRNGNFQVWSDPAIDQATVSIPLDVAIAPNESGRSGAVPESAGAEFTAWLFMPEDKDLSELTLELALFDRGNNRRRLRFGVAREPGHA